MCVSLRREKQVIWNWWFPLPTFTWQRLEKLKAAPTVKQSFTVGVSVYHCASLAEVSHFLQLCNCFPVHGSLAPNFRAKVILFPSLLCRTYRKIFYQVAVQKNKSDRMKSLSFLWFSCYWVVSFVVSCSLVPKTLQRKPKYSCVGGFYRLVQCSRFK